MSKAGKKNLKDTINMLPSKGKPDLDAAARLMVPLILETIYSSEVEKNSKNSDDVEKNTG